MNNLMKIPLAFGRGKPHSEGMKKTAQTGTVNMVLVRSLEREYARAIRAEENAPTLAGAWRLAAASERSLRRLQAARAGQPLPESRAPRNARSMARDAFAALATIGRAIARAVKTEAALRKAQAAAAMARAARLAARSVRTALRMTVRAIAQTALSLAAPAPAPTEIESLIATLPRPAGLELAIAGEWIVMSGGRWGAHQLAVSASSAARVLAHWRGYCENNGAVVS
jgi:hypothetical protein